jgi:GWxTD domain-containing protein
MNRTRKTALILPVTLICCVASIYGVSSREIDIEVVRYFPTANAMIIDAFIEIPMMAMQYEKVDIGKQKYHLSFDVDLYAGEEKLYHDEWERSSEVENRLVTSEKAYIIEPVLHVPLDIGGYNLEIRVRDEISGNVQEFKREIVDPGESLILSDIVLANSIVPDTTTQAGQLDIFRKGNLRINANCGADFVGASSLIYFYYQIRNEKEEPRSFLIDMEILDASGKLVKKLPPRNLMVGSGVQADAGAFSCSGLQVGGYFLKLSTKKPEVEESEDPIVVTKSFSVAVEEEVMTKEKEKIVVRNEFAGFSETQCDSVFSMMRYILSKSQKKEYEALNVEGKRNYLHTTWKALDPIPATEENEFRDEISGRINFALDEFGTIWKAKRGEETTWAIDDRGVIYIKYGPPDERLIRPNEYGSDPYEIWKYYNSGYSYLFLEKIRTQGHELIFTNNRDEPYLPTWPAYFPPLILEDIYRELGSAAYR